MKYVSLITLALVSIYVLTSQKVERRISATSCFQQTLNGKIAEMRVGSSDPKQTEGIGVRGDLSVTLYCPIPSDSILPHASIDEVQIHGLDSGLCEPAPSIECPAYIIAYVCVSYLNVADGECSPFKRTEVRGGNYVISFKRIDRDYYLNMWTLHPTGYPYIRVQLTGPAWNGDTSTVRGITVSGHELPAAFQFWRWGDH